MHERYRRQTDRRTMTYSEHELEFTFANKTVVDFFPWRCKLWNFFCQQTCGKICLKLLFDLRCGHAFCATILNSFFCWSWHASSFIIDKCASGILFLHCTVTVGRVTKRTSSLLKIPAAPVFPERSSLENITQCYAGEAHCWSKKIKVVILISVPYVSCLFIAYCLQDIAKYFWYLCCVCCVHFREYFVRVYVWSNSCIAAVCRNNIVLFGTCLPCITDSMKLWYYRQYLRLLCFQ